VFPAACRLADSSGLWKATDSRFNEYAAVTAFTGMLTGAALWSLITL
jgi:hypothetical protein